MSVYFTLNIVMAEVRVIERYTNGRMVGHGSAIKAVLKASDVFTTHCSHTRTIDVPRTP